MTKLVVRWSKWFSIALVGLMLFVAIGLSVILFTPSGLKLVIWAAEKSLPQLSVESYSGALFPRFTLNKVSFQDESWNVDAVANSITLGVDVSCFMEASICVNELDFNGLKFSMPELLSDPHSSAEPATGNDSSFSSPIPFIVKRLSLSDVDLNILGYKAQIGVLTSGLTFVGERLSIDKTSLTSTKLTLEEEESSAGSPTNTSTSSQHNIELPEIVLPLQIELSRLDVNDFVLVQDTPVVVNHLGLEAQAIGSEITIPMMQLDTPELEGILTGAVTLVGGYPIILDLETTIKQPVAKGQTLKLTASGSIADLTLNAELGGLVKGNIEAFLQPLTIDMLFDVSVTKAEAQWPLLGQGDYFVSVDRLNAKGSLDGYNIDLTSAISGKAVPDTQLNILGNGDLNQIELQTLSVKTLGGEVSGKVMANWQAAINWSADLLLLDIQPGLQWQKTEGKVSGHLMTTGSLTDQGGWQVTLPKLDIDGVVRGYPLNLDGQLSVSDKAGSGELKLITPGLVLAHGPNFVKAKGIIDQKSDVQINVSFHDMSLSVPDLHGDLQGNIALKGSVEAPVIDLNLNASDVGWGEDINAQNVEIKGELSPLSKLSGDIRLSALGVKYQNYLIDHAFLNAKGNEKKHTLNLDIKSNVASTKLNLQGVLERTPELVWKGVLEDMFITSKQGMWTLEQSTHVGFSAQSQQAFIAAHCWGQSGTSICLDKDMNAGESGEAQVSIINLDFEQLNVFLPSKTELEGELNLSAMANWAPDTPPQVVLDLEMAQGMVKDHNSHPIQLGWEQVSVKAGLKDNTLSADWLIDLKDNGDFSGNAKIVNVIDDNKLLDGNIQLQDLRLDFLEPFLGDYSQFKSTLNTKLSFNGPIMQPEVQGQFLLDDISIKGEITPIEVDSGKVEIDFSGYGASLSAAINTPDGQLQASGDADWRDLKNWQAKMRVFADELMVNLPPMVKVKVIPDMTILASPKLARIDGTISLPWGRVVVEELPPSAIGVSKDQVILNNQLEPKDFDTKMPFSVETNVNISIGEDFKLSAFGLEGDLSGNLNVAQRDKGPFVTGEVNIIDGSYRSFGQDLIIQQGKILMNGPVDQPFVQITAIRNPDNTQNGYTAGIKVIGPVDEPTVTIFSEPSLPQANALSYLLRGQDIDGESGGNTVTSTLIGLSLAKSGRVVGEIGEAFGVQDLQLDTAGSGDDSQVTVSGYVFPGLQVKYGVGIFDSVGEFTVRYRLMQDLYVEAISGLDSAVDLLYQFEFN
ncbi:autotransporter assembly complex protein TamB [Vibrio hepatarius]|uniref:autotransporter assembly complex protein TamB n=1 Tax=Vibrio hepatarius TaxID=171383 RepID=UPI001C09E481|nr:translocation/assembly module TamB domain-containing protein [Vibrio hepatarius]MBU2898796.1 translocation/assembly module TamB [Vibrio hepatarius]